MSDEDFDRIAKLDGKRTQGEARAVIPNGVPISRGYLGEIRIMERNGVSSCILEPANKPPVTAEDLKFYAEAPLMAKLLREFKEENDELMKECDIWRDQVQSLNELDIAQTAKIEKYEKVLKKITKMITMGDCVDAIELAQQELNK